MKHPRRCTARLSDRSRRCRKAAMKGATVCRTHGGAAPQTRDAARRRLLALAEPALAGLDRALRGRNHAAVVSAARAVLDRAGFPARSELTVEAEVETVDPRRLSTATLRAVVRELRGEPADEPDDEQLEGWEVL